MEAVQHTFKRYETKFLLDEEQFLSLLPVLQQHLQPDEYGRHTICNVYYDTPGFDLIRNSIEKPVYKEKFRLRSYGTPDADGTVFAEIKKKYDGVVYKRRVDASPAEIRSFLAGQTDLPKNPQIQREIRWFQYRYRPVPQVYLAYDRMAYYDPADGLRLTFDWNIRWRMQDLFLEAGDGGAPIFSDKRFVMEVKTPQAIPLWLAGLLCDRGIYPSGFSKYGTCYQQFIAPGVFGSKGENHDF